MTTNSGIPLKVFVSGANEHDISFILPLVFLGIPAIGGKPGRPRRIPSVVRADCGYTSQSLLGLFDEVGIDAQIPQRGKKQVRGLGRLRWPVERTFAWLKQYRRVGTRRDRLANTYESFVTLACAMVSFSPIKHFGL